MVVGYRWKNQGKGVGQSRYQELRRRQVKIETEMWEEAAKEYRELLMLHYVQYTHTHTFYTILL